MRPAHPRRIPMTRYPSRSARIVIARMAGLRPGTSPPPVRIASVPFVVLITFRHDRLSRYATSDHSESQCEHALAVWSVEAPNSVAVAGSDLRRFLIAHRLAHHPIPTEGPMRTVILVVAGAVAATACNTKSDAPAPPAGTATQAGGPKRDYSAVAKTLVAAGL